MKRILQSAILLVILIACGEVKQKYELPIIGRSEVVERDVDGKTIYDTVYHTIDDFRFVNQDSAIVTNATFEDKVYVTDFFFTSCPTICPIMKQQMLRIHEAYKDNPQVALLSHTIDPKYDTVALLKDFSEKLGVSSDKWHFVTGDQDKIYDIGEKSYLSVMAEEEGAPGGYIHSGAIILVDKERRIRSVMDGTVPEQVDVMIADIQRLLDEYDAK
ncbi:MAG: SCO family protein [Cytophagales bacterium]|nr:SCO family protein [Cytophagales bacterium]